MRFIAKGFFVITIFFAITFFAASVLPKKAMADTGLVNEGYGWAKEVALGAAASKTLTFKTFSAKTGSALQADSISIAVVPDCTNFVCGPSPVTYSYSCNGTCSASGIVTISGIATWGRYYIYSSVNKSGYHETINPNYFFGTTGFSAGTNNVGQYVYLTCTTACASDSYRLQITKPVQNVWYNYLPAPLANANPGYAVPGGSSAGTSVSGRIGLAGPGPLAGPFPRVLTFAGAFSAGTAEGWLSVSGFVSDNQNNFSGSNAGFNFGYDKTAPIVSCSASKVGSNYQINLTSSDVNGVLAVSGVSYGQVQVSDNGGAYANLPSGSGSFSGTVNYAYTAGHTYTFRFRAADNAQNASGLSGIGFSNTSGYVTCTVQPDAPAGLVTTLPPGCVGVNWGGASIGFGWTANLVPPAVDNYTVQVSKKTDLFAAGKTASRIVATSPVSVSTTGALTPSPSWVDGGSALVGATGLDQFLPGVIYSWEVRANNSVLGNSAWTIGTDFSVPLCPPTVPIHSVLPCASTVDGNGFSYVSGNSITFSWGAAAGATSYEIQFQGDNANSPGFDPILGDFTKQHVKNLAAISGTSITGTGAMSTVWTVGGGASIFNAYFGRNPSWGLGTPAALVFYTSTSLHPTPITYQWHVRAVGASGAKSAWVGGTLISPVACQYDLQVEFVNSTWQDSANNYIHPGMSFQPNDTARVDVKVTNLNTTGSVSPVSDLYIYYQSAGVPICPTAATMVPGDAVGTSQSYPIPSIASGGTNFVTISVMFQIGTAGDTAYAIADPLCLIDASPWTNNVATQTYFVDADGFFETQGGDVGSAGASGIGTSFDSSTLATPLYQSDYVIAANSIGTRVNTRKWKMASYTSKQVPNGGIYEYFAVRFLTQAQLNPTCGNFNKPPLAYCSGSFTFNTGGASPKTAPTVDQVIFVDDDLIIESDLVLNPDVTLIFIVKENIKVSLGVKEIDGVFISKEGFTDSNVAASASGVALATDLLTVKGAVYVDAIGGTMDLRRYFTGPFNNTTPSVKFIFEPKYLAKPSVINMIGVKSIKWREINP